MSEHRIIIDCDPGQDDAIALLLALASPQELDIAGITCVAGNAPIEKTVENALRVRELARRPNIPIFAGCPRPILQTLTTADDVHGLTGLDGVALPEPSGTVESQHGVSFIIDSCRDAIDKSVTLCPIGPMTNIALALVMAPDIAKKIRKIVFMGGSAFGPGNITRNAEFNFFVDPHAAQIVLNSGIASTMFGLDVTRMATATPDRKQMINNIATPSARAVGQMLTFYSCQRDKNLEKASRPLHDPCVIAYLLKPELFKGKDYQVRVNTNLGPELGKTLIDGETVSEPSKNCCVITEIDTDGFFSLLMERLNLL